MAILDLARVPVPHAKSSQRPSFVSTQVTEARRYYLDLRPAPSRGIVVVCGGCERVRPDYVVQRRTFPFIAVEFVAEGEGTVELKGSKFRLRPGTVFAYRAGVPHVIRSAPARPMLKYYVDFTGDEALRLLKGTPLASWQSVQMSAVREVRELFELLQREGASESPFGAKICAGLIPVLLTKITERAIAAGSVEPRALATYERVKRWIEEHFLEVRTISEIAKACHVDAAYLCRLFQRFSHTSPYQFLTHLKMGRATELLLDRAMLVKEAAAELGCGDPFQFSRAFKRVYGLSPEQFIRHGRGVGGDEIPSASPAGSTERATRSRRG